MLYGWADGTLEVRASKGGGATIRGEFPYGKLATLDAGGRNRKPRKERFGPKAFDFVVQDETRNVHLLSGHDYSAVLADRASKTLMLRDTDAALIFEARILPEIMDLPHVKTALALLASGLASGVSPGFRVPDNIPDSEEVTEESPALGKALIRTVKKAVLYELSLVTSAAYKEATAEVEARSWQVSQRAVNSTINPRYRWRL